MENVKAYASKAVAWYGTFGGSGQRLILGFCALLAVFSVVTLCIVFPPFFFLCIILLLLAALTGVAFMLGDMMKGL